MALQISKTKKVMVEHDMELMYWSIIRTDINWLEKKATISIAGFMDKDAHDMCTMEMDIPMQQHFYYKEETIKVGTGKYETIDDVEVEIMEDKFIPFPFSPDDNIIKKAYELVDLIIFVDDKVSPVIFVDVVTIFPVPN